MNEETRSNTQNPNSAQRDKLEGSAQKAGGRVKESVGALTDNDRLRAEGQGDQVAGSVRQKKGTLKDRIKSWIDRR